MVVLSGVDRERHIYPRGSVYIKDGRIAAVGEDVTVPGQPDLVIDAEHKVVLPGFVNAHSHLQQYFRGTYELIGNFYEVNLPLEGYRSPEDMEWLGLASCAEYIYGGCTSALVIYTYPDGFARAVEKAGNRAILAGDVEEVDLAKLKDGVYEYLPEKGAAAVERAKALYRNWHGKAEGRITTCMSAKAPDLARPETYLEVKKFAEEHGLRMSTHLAQSRREVEQVSLEQGKKADVITFNMLNPFLTPTKDPLTSIILYGSSADIDTVIVDGNILKENGLLTTMDMKQALLTAQVRVEKIIDRFFREHPKQKTNWQQKVPYMK